MTNVRFLVSLLVLFLSVTGTDTYHRNGETLIFSNTDPNLDSEVKQRLVDTFFEVYPKMKRDFNPKAPDTIRVKIDTSYGGAAYAHDGRVVISSAWLHKKPHDTDVITHEVMHIVQSYPGGSGPGWLTEGIADYVRYKYGVDNASAGWSLHLIRPKVVIRIAIAPLPVFWCGCKITMGMGLCKSWIEKCEIKLIPHPPGMI